MMLEIHPAAMLFPLMAEDELESLTEDIRNNGLLEPILLYGGAVIDGRNRLIACQNANVEPHFKEVGPLDSPVTFAISHNLHRRHLTQSQKAAIAVEMIPLLSKEARERQLKGAYCGDAVRGEAAEIAGEIVGVGARIIYHAKKVMEESPESFERIKTGEISVDYAAKSIRHEESPSPLSARYSESAMRKLSVTISTIEGCCHGLRELNPRAISGVDSADIHVWIEKAEQCARDLRSFAKKMEEVCR